MALSKITTESLLDGEITLPKLSSGTDGNIISYDASGNPVAVATGNDGQVLTSTGAGSPPAFEDAGGGCWTIISERTVSGVSSIEFASLTSHSHYEIRFDGLYTANNAQVMLARVSTDNGSSYETAGNYFYNMRHYSSATATNHVHDGVPDSMRFQGNTSSTSTLTISGRIWFDNIGNTNAPKIFNFQTGMFKATPNNIEVTYGVMGWKTSTAVNAIKLYPGSGTLYGNFALFGAT